MQKIAIFSDSRVGIMALSSDIIGSKLVWESLGKLNKLGNENKVLLYRVPGHAGIEGNEQANKLARKGSTVAFVGPETFCGIGFCTYKEDPKKREEKTRALLGKNPIKSEQLRILSGFITGHCHLKEQLTRIELQLDRDAHLVANCFGITNYRVNHFGTDVIDDGEISSSKPSQLLEFIKALKLDREL